jgi:hypothetical protein
MTKQQFSNMLYQLCEDCDCHTNKPYCTLIEFLTNSHNSPRLLLQMKCVEKFKFERHQDIPLSEAFMIWAEEGYAQTFSDVYIEDMKFKDLYKKIIDKRPI